MTVHFKLIVGLGNPGTAYQATRHNAGFWFVDLLANQYRAEWRSESRFHADVTELSCDGQRIYLLKPATYMNRSGQSLAAFSRYYKIHPEQILVAHDELDLEPGIIRLKQGGGHGGHNGLRDIITALGGEAGFFRLRIGIGHPGSSREVSDYVLGKPAEAEHAAIEMAIDEAAACLPALASGDIARVQQRLHSRA